MNLKDYLTAVETLALAVGDHWFVTADPLAYELATRLAQLAAEFRRRDEARHQQEEGDPHGEPAREAERAVECDDRWRGTGDRTVLHLAGHLWDLHGLFRRMLEVQRGNPNWAVSGEIVVGERGEN